MANAERVLHALIHDARTPIGVGQGYLRLLQEQRLETAEDRERAMARTITALGRLARLCDEASELISETDTAIIPASVAASAFAASVEARLRQSHFVVDRVAIDADARVGVVGNIDHLAEAVSLVLATTVYAARDTRASLHVETRAAELRLVGAPHDHGLVTGDESHRQAFDPWRLGGLAIPVACQRINRASGRVWHLQPAVIVAFPLETSPT